MFYRACAPCSLGWRRTADALGIVWPRGHSFRENLALM